jgi:hypothetical protein
MASSFVCAIIKANDKEDNHIHIHLSTATIVVVTQ